MSICFDSQFPIGRKVYYLRKNTENTVEIGIGKVASIDITDTGSGCTTIMYTITNTGDTSSSATTYTVNVDDLMTIDNLFYTLHQILPNKLLP